MLDEGAPASVAEAFLKRGHRVIFHSDVLQPGAKDDVVCAAAMLNRAALIAVDRDMKQSAKRFGNPDKHGKYSRLNLIFVGCNEVMAAKRLEHAMSFIEHEWKVAHFKAARTLWLDIRAGSGNLDRRISGFSA